MNTSNRKFHIGSVCAGLCFMTLAATGLRAEPEGKLVSQWKMSNFDGSEVKNGVPEAGALTLEDTKGVPVPAEEAEVKGLRFEKEALNGKSIEIPDLGAFCDPQRPFAVRMVVVPIERQSGAYAGLFQAGGIGQKGFRMFINQQFKIGINISSDDENYALCGKTILALGTAYTVEVRFAGMTVTLLVNGEVEAEKEVPSLTPYEGLFRIGRASGQDYDFNGIIGEVSVFALKP
ncbi:MAG: LamG-like jellyroll fold domain-containing protein [Verrucomicrobiae bacterium]